MLKRYLREPGSELVHDLMADDPEWCASTLALTEAHITLCHVGLGDTDLDATTGALQRDWEHIIRVPVDDLCLARAREIGCAYRVRTLDAIHLAAAERIPRPATFVTFDRRQGVAAAELGLTLVDGGE